MAATPLRKTTPGKRTASTTRHDPVQAHDRPVVLITGSSGLIGTKLRSTLVSDYEVVGLDKQPPDEFGDGWFIETDLTDDGSVRRALDEVRRRCGTRVASCVHLAAYYDFSGEPSPLYDELTVEGTRRLMTGLREFELEQFVFSSSLLVMKPAGKGDPPLTEDAPTRAEWDYPASKLSAERLLRDEHGDVPVVVLRLAGVYTDEGHLLPVAQQIRRISERQLESLVFPGDASHGQPFVHVDDVTACVSRVIERRRDLAPWDVFLVAEPEVLSYRDLQSRLGRLIHGEAWPAIRIPKPVARAGAWAKDKLPGSDPFIKPWMVDIADDHYPVAIAHARERLDWAPRRSLGEALPSMVDALKRDPRAWYRAHKLPLPDSLMEHA